MENISWLSLILSTLVPTVLGFIWYNKMVFGNAWMKSIGMTEEKAKEANMTKVLAISILMAFLLTFFLFGWNNGPGQEGDFDSFGHGAFHGAALGIFVAMPLFIANGLFEQKSWKAMWINIGFWTLALTIMGGIVDVMNHMPNEVTY